MSKNNNAPQRQGKYGVIMMATWFKIEFTGDATDADRERASQLIAEGYTEGELINDDEDESA